MSRPWKALRANIGRKITALALALLVWAGMDNFVLRDRRFELEVRVFATRRLADEARAQSDVFCLVVPPELMVRSTQPAVLRVKVRGLKDDVDLMRLSGVLEFGPADLGDADAYEKPHPLDRESFDVRIPSHLTEFKVATDTLVVRLERRAHLDVELNALNVTTTGEPRDGFYFANSKITLRPSRVRVEGPRGAIEPLRADPSEPKLTPVDVEGKSSAVTQLVGLPAALLEQGVSLLTPGGQVEVTIPIVPDDVTVELFSVPVTYLRAEALAQRKQKVLSRTERLDLLVTGPASELNALKPEQLAAKIFLIHDWTGSTLATERPKVQVATVGLSPAVRITDLVTKEEPRIEYALGPLPEAGTP